MTAIKGANAKLALAVSGTFNTAATVAAGDGLEVESWAWPENPAELGVNPIGSGNSMESESERGVNRPEPSFSKPMSYDDAGIAALAQFQGTANVNNDGGGFYCHSLLFNETLNAKFLTVVEKKTDTTLAEAASAVCTRVEIAAEDAPNYVIQSVDLLANEKEIASPTNQTADIDAVTVADGTRVVIRPQDNFYINAQAGGALGGGDELAIRSAVLELVKAQEFVPEIKGSTGHSEPTSGSNIPLAGTLTIELKNLADLTYFTAANAGTEYKASLQIDNDSSGYEMNYYIPRMKIIPDIEHSLSSPGDNPVTITFKILVAASNPTGMLSTYPYFRIINQESTAYLA